MRKLIHLNFLSWFLIVVMLSVAINGVHESAHAMQKHVSVEAASQDFSLSHECPCPPIDQHNDCDGCDICSNCTCNAPLTVKPFQLSYNPFMMDLSSPDPAGFSPEVYLSLFVPPDSSVA
ncbi:MAG: hypothetical protein HY888_11320 [Deltaproteobacteria bacterium]|nr:hypothetical protein [Deltaproteobacteria bacterium]